MPTKKKDEQPPAAPAEDRAFINMVLDKLEEERLRRGMTQVQFCSAGGVSDQTWMYWRRGRMRGTGAIPKLSTLAKLIRAHNLRVSFLAEGEGADADLSQQMRQVASYMRLLPTKDQAEVLGLVEEAIRKMIAARGK